MNTKQITKYQCSICNTWYDSADEAQRCESRPVSQDKGAKVGDVVMVTGGDGAGRQATVTSVFVFDKDWGHYAADRYWHTVGLTADLIGTYGSRQLTFDNYKVTA